MLNIHKMVRDSGVDVDPNPLEHLTAFVPKTVPLVHEWQKLIEDSANEFAYLMDQKREFKMPRRGEGGEAVAYGLVPFTTTITDERVRAEKVGVLAFIAREMGEYTGTGRLHIRGTDQRGWGRLTNWCKALMGLSTYQGERDEDRGGRPPAPKDKPKKGKKRAGAAPQGPKPKKGGDGGSGDKGGKGGARVATGGASGSRARA
jgi:hypothetical protein